MKTKIAMTLLAIVISHINANSQALGADGPGVTQNYIPNNLLNQTTSGRTAATELNCGGYPTSSFMPGMFQYDGDLESFATASHGTTTQCVATTYTVTHQMAPFQDNTCLNSAWKVSHGTPEIGANQSNHFMHIWSGDWTTDGDLEGEGLFYDCELIACRNYTISLRLSSTATINKIYFYIASGLQHKTKDGNEWIPESSFYKVPNVPSAYLIHSISNFNSGTNNWVTISLPAFAPPNSGMKLWIFSEDDKIDVMHQGPDLLFIDDVTDGLPGSSSTCTGNITYTLVGSIPTFSKANTITASVGTTGPTEFVAGSTVTLAPGFKTASNSTFYAHIIPCTTANNCPVGCPTCRTSSESAQNLKVAGIEVEDYYELGVYPNPTNGEMRINKPVNEKIISIKLMTESTGQEVGFVSYEELDSSIKFSAGATSKGVFILLLKTEKRLYASRVIVN